jgi:PAS domain S-box-containing protein
MVESNSSPESKLDARFRRVIENMSSGVVIYEITPDETNFTVTAINGPAVKMANQTKENILGKLITDAFPGAKDYGIFDVLMEVYKGAEPRVFQPEKYTDDHLVGWFKNYVYSISDTEVVAFFEDVTDQVVNEERITTALNRLEMITNASGLGIWHRDLATNELTFNDKMLEIYQIPETEVEDGLTYETWAKYLPPEDLQRVVESTERVISSHKTETIIFRIHRGDGKLRFIEATSALEFDPSGKPTILVGTNQDITSEHMESSRIKEAEQRWRGVLESTGQGVWEWDNTTNKSYYSSKWKALLGFDDEDIGETHEDWKSLIHPDDLPNANKALEAHLKGTEAFYEYTARYKTKSGNWAWMNTRGTVVQKTQSGEPVRIIGAMTDINDTYLESNRLEQLADQVPGYLYQFMRHPDGSYSLPYLSNGVKELYELDKEQVKQDFALLFELIHPHDKASFTASIERSAQDMKVWSQEFRVIVPKAGLKYIKAVSKPEKLDDGSIVWHGYNWDVTEERLREAALQDTEMRFRLAIEATGLGIWSGDAITGMATWSDEAYRMLGYEPGSFEVSAEKFQSLVHPDDLAHLNEQINKGKNSNDTFVAQFRLRTASNEWLWIESRGKSTDHDDKGNAITMMGTHMDISFIKESESQLRQAQHKAELAAEAKSEFLANMSHEIRTPLSGVLGMVDLLLNSENIEEQKQYANNIRYSAQSLLEIINDILDISKIEAGEMSISHSEFNLHELLEKIITPFAQLIKSKNLTFNKSSNLDEGKNYIGDKKRIQQVLNNLLGNAYKFTEHGSVSVSISRTEQQDDNETILIKVTDTGIGIADEQLNKLFKRFSQVETKKSRRFGGTGLGLAISKNLVELMGGEIGVESEQDKGSTFWFKLNLPVSSHRQSTSQEPRALTNQFNGKVLVVEDNVINQQVANGVLNKLGLQVELANNGQECLEMLGNAHYDLIFMDLQMPVMDGLETTQRIRNAEVSTESRNVPIVAVTANVLPEERQRCLEYGMNDHISKPLEIDAIIQVLKRYTKAS